ncbi:MAG: 4'-phosphopantetheinyl transferase family protein, partial [Persicimonas sp.]
GVARPGEGICIRCRHRDDASEHAIAFDVEITTADGRLLQVMDKVELIGHRALEADEQFAPFDKRTMTTRRLTYPEAELLLNDLGLTTDEILDDAEREAYDRLRSETRRGEWLAARVAAKDLVCSHLRDFYGTRPSLSEVVIAKDEHGAPSVQLRAEAADKLGAVKLPSISITHCNGVAIAALSGPGAPARVGVDLELIEERGESFADDYFGDSERSLTLPVDISNGSEGTSVLLTTLWSIKEAVSKALGLGLHLNTGEVTVAGLTEVDGSIAADVELSGRAQEAFEALGATSVEVRCDSDGTFCFARAWMGVDQGADATAHIEAAPGVEKSNDAWVDVAAVAALLEHKGLLEEPELGRDEVKGERLSPWKQS